MKKIQFLIILFLISHFSVAQWGVGTSEKEVQKIDVEDIIEEILTTKKDTLSFISVEILDSPTNKSGDEESYIFNKKFLKTYYSNLIEYDKDSLIIIRPYVEIYNVNSTPGILKSISGVNFRKGLEAGGSFNPSLIDIYNVAAESIILRLAKVDLDKEQPYNEIWFLNSSIKALDNYSHNDYSTILINNIQTGRFNLFLNGETEMIRISNNKLGELNRKGTNLKYSPIEKADSIPVGFKENSREYSHEFYFKEVKRLNISKNHSSHKKLNSISGNINSLEMVKNEYNGSLHLYDLKVIEEIIFAENKLNKDLGLKSVILPEFPELVNFSFDNFKGNKLSNIYHLSGDYYSSGLEHPLGIIYKPEKKEEFENKRAFEQLISDYNRFYRIYKDRGDLESSNEIFIEMKDLYTQKYKYEYLDSGEMKDWFRWRLNQLLKVYTEHGTDPAKALVMSFYIVLLFAFIYLFFPSEWDIHSKSKIFENIKDALEKDKKGTFKSILLSLYHLFIMVINAFTLSLNSFTTLGFGNIPTKGLARYLTIIQGFVGWFLLGLFSVSLINQVLA